MSDFSSLVMIIFFADCILQQLLEVSYIEEITSLSFYES